MIVAFLCGVLFAVIVVFLAAVAWVYSQPVVPARPKGFGPHDTPRLPKVS